MVYKGIEPRARTRDFKAKATKESTYQRKLLKKLKAIPKSYFFCKEAGSIRGIADLIGTINGVFVALEVKKSLEEAKKYSPRSALQNKFLADINRAGGLAFLIYPENEEEILNILYGIIEKH